MNTKQVIVIRRDLKMRRGKEIAQGAHASMMFLTKALQATGASYDDLNLTEEEQYWTEGSFKKVVCAVKSEEEFDDVIRRASEAGLTCHVVTDSGLTEFNGVPTRTALAIGPHDEKRFKEVTDHLELY